MPISFVEVPRLQMTPISFVKEDPESPENPTWNLDGPLGSRESRKRTRTPSTPSSASSASSSEEAQFIKRKFFYEDQLLESDFSKDSEFDQKLKDVYKECERGDKTLTRRKAKLINAKLINPFEYDDCLLCSKGYYREEDLRFHYSKVGLFI